MVRYIDEAEVAAILTPGIVRALMERTLAAGAAGDAEGPLRSVLPLGGAWFAAMPAVVRLDDVRALGAKLVTAFPGNAARGVPTHQATVVLFEPDTGELQAVVAGVTITTLRTAAVSAVATRRLAVRPRGTLAVLGAGVQGRAHVEAFLAANLVERLHIWNQSARRAQALAAYAAERGLQATLYPSPAACAAGADVVVTATAASEPLLSAAVVAEGTHVNAVGSCVPDRRELAADLVAAAAVYADSRAGAEREAGDLILAARELGTPILVRAELGEMLADPSRAVEPARFTLFESLGLGIEDIACAAYVAARAGHSSSTARKRRTPSESSPAKFV